MIVFFVAILTSLGVGAKILFSNESSVTAADFEQGHSGRGEQTLNLLHIANWICLLAYKLAGMNWFDAFNHAMTTIATGGFSTHEASFAHFNSPLIESVSILFMLLSATTFIFVIRLLEGAKDTFRRGMEVYVFYALTVLSMGLIAGLLLQSNPSVPQLKNIQDALFQTASIITTTGYTSANYELWVPAAKLFSCFLCLWAAARVPTAGA